MSLQSGLHERSVVKMSAPFSVTELSRTSFDGRTDPIRPTRAMAPPCLALLNENLSFVNDAAPSRPRRLLRALLVARRRNVVVVRGVRAAQGALPCTPRRRGTKRRWLGIPRGNARVPVLTSVSTYGPPSYARSSQTSTRRSLNSRSPRIGAAGGSIALKKFVKIAVEELH